MPRTSTLSATLTISLSNIMPTYYDATFLFRLTTQELRELATLMTDDITARAMIQREITARLFS